MSFETNITTFEMARPVLRGLETLLPTVRLIGRLVADDLHHAVILPRLPSVRGEIASETSDFYDIGELPDNVAGEPRFTAYKKIRLPFLRYAADNRLEMPLPDFHRLASFLNRGGQSPSNRVREIPTKLSQIALEYDGTTDSNHAVVSCSGFTVEPAYAKSGYEISLKVTNPQRFHAEANVYTAAIKQIRALKPFLKQYNEISHDEDMAIPLGWIAEDMAPDEEASIYALLGTYSLKKYTIQLGQILPPYVQR